jgi:aspartyl-tRNA(Asn)/glutamyl-tRNA(Gln) amidotransferase subunit A
MTDLAFMPLAEASRRIRAREMSPVDLTQALLARIERLDPAINAFLLVTAESALAEAKTAEAEIARGHWRGALHGIPYAAKDLIDVAGLATTCHSKLRRDHRAAADAAVIAQLRAAGAVLIGKLALHEFAYGGPAFDLPWPPARNPWDRTRHPGGSSSGSGAALAAGLVPATLGTDTGGSIRNPATACGIVGMKPTFGLVSCAGVFPLAASLDHVGPMTRTVEDNALMLQAIAGYDPADPYSVRAPQQDFCADLRRGVSGLRIGVIEHFYNEDLIGDAEHVEALEAAFEVLGRLGAQVSRLGLAPLEAWRHCGRTIQNAESYALHERDLTERPTEFAAITRQKLMRGAGITVGQYIAATRTRAALRNAFAEATRDLDAVVTISSHDLPCRIDDADAVARTYERQARIVFNVTGTPALAVPTGFSAAGVPLGMQIAGKAFDEAMLYRIAHAYCEATGWCERHPSLTVHEPAAAAS